ncbi:hypothetical protein MESS4_280098 [Mesorhizobium sp. STM 4661]|nr:hypothetical protein MESS4_280098 [Mesorhizobium sp. STM 4661]
MPATEITPGVLPEGLQ